MKTKKIILLTILIAAFCVQANAQTNVETITFDENKHDFGTIKEGDGKVSVTFTFTNKGDTPLVISKVVVSCGCTASDWTREPVAPGKQGYIKATYDPTNRIYYFNKSLRVYSNGNPSKVALSIRGAVVR
jgi:hypothetical protein